MPSQTQLTKNDIDMPYWLINDGVRSIRGTRLPDCSVIGSYWINSQSSHCFFGIQVLTVFVKCHLWLEVGTHKIFGWLGILLQAKQFLQSGKHLTRACALVFYKLLCVHYYHVLTVRTENTNYGLWSYLPSDLQLANMEHDAICFVPMLLHSSGRMY